MYASFTLLSPLYDINHAVGLNSDYLGDEVTFPVPTET